MPLAGAGDAAAWQWACWVAACRSPFTSALRGHADTPADLLPWDGQADGDTARARLFEEVLTRFADLCARHC